MRLTDAMWAANPDLRALANARFAEVGSVGRAAILAGVGLPADDPIMELCIAAVEAVVAAHFIAFMAHEPSPERHNALVHLSPRHHRRCQARCRCAAAALVSSYDRDRGGVGDAEPEETVMRTEPMPHHVLRGRFSV